MTNKSPNPLWRYALFNLVVLALIGAWLWQQNQPVKLAEPKLAVDGKLQCVSYAPYYGEGQTPFIKGTHISQVQIENDLKLLAKHSQCVRIYSVNQGLDYVPVAASKIGLKVLLGAWIGWVDSDNVQEIKVATQLANKYPDTVIGLIVGNEVLLRGEQTEQAIADYIKLAKQSTVVLVTYANI
jgi:exo-beta-1,3-glucanase (GH17 family)